MYTVINKNGNVQLNRWKAGKTFATVCRTQLSFSQIINYGGWAGGGGRQDLNDAASTMGSLRVYDMR